MKRITTQREIRAAFWENWYSCGDVSNWYKGGKSHNDYPADIRCAFVDFVDYLQKSGFITEKLAERVTL